jgi:hypothetical protein
LSRFATVDNVIQQYLTNGLGILVSAEDGFRIQRETEIIKRYEPKLAPGFEFGRIVYFIRNGFKPIPNEKFTAEYARIIESQSDMLASGLSLGLFY